MAKRIGNVYQDVASRWFGRWALFVLVLVLAEVGCGLEHVFQIYAWNSLSMGAIHSISNEWCLDKTRPTPRVLFSSSFGFDFDFSVTWKEHTVVGGFTTRLPALRRSGILAPPLYVTQICCWVMRTVPFDLEFVANCENGNKNTLLVIVLQVLLPSVIIFLSGSTVVL